MKTGTMVLAAVALLLLYKATSSTANVQQFVRSSLGGSQYGGAYGDYAVGAGSTNIFALNPSAPVYTSPDYAGNVGIGGGFAT